VRRLGGQAEALLAEWNLTDRRDVPTRELSYGEQRQVELLLALAGRPRALLLDEPTAGLSAAETATVVAMIKRFPSDVTVLLIEHDMDVAFTLAERITVLHQGRVLAEGSREDIQADARVREIYVSARCANVRPRTDQAPPGEPVRPRNRLCSSVSSLVERP